jgi:hypothetical protein
MYVVSGVVWVDQVDPPFVDVPHCPPVPRKTAEVGVAKSIDPPADAPVESGELHVTPPSVVRMTYPPIPCTRPTNSLANAIDESSDPNGPREIVALISHDLPLFVERKIRGVPPTRPFEVENHAMLPEIARLFVRPYSLDMGTGMFVEETGVQLVPPSVVVKMAKDPPSGSPINTPLFAS